MTIDLVNILDKNCPLRTPEMAFQRIKSSKFSGGECPQTILAARPFSTGLIKKISWFYSLKRLISIHLVLIDQIFGGGGGRVVEEIIKFWPNLEICGRIHILWLFK